MAEHHHHVPRWLDVPWHDLFVPTIPIIEVVLRGSITYLILFFLLRLIRNRSSGGSGTTDLLLIVLIADAVQNAMAGEYKSISEGLVLALTIFFWAFFLDWIAWRFPVMRRILKSPPARLVHRGRIVQAAMRRELLTRADLMDELRKQEVHDLLDVESACIESDGSFTIVRKSDATGDARNAG
ncbi:DUF421 domain-containing protein [Rhizosaccharibacter radicis]|uniref:DUF421 domain-containing protein n=1 Tax=Rhizosaccharibacter radicis TaxID=2782605 RepID=A0ABT1VY09_9PROT|nr:DUF421 domain-containing protein [Acetobacteraceae bacterium KSS12]